MVQDGEVKVLANVRKILFLEVGVVSLREAMEVGDFDAAAVVLPEVGTTAGSSE